MSGYFRSSPIVQAKECLSSRIIYATLLLRLGVDYIQIHEPHIAARLMPTNARPSLAP